MGALKTSQTQFRVGPIASDRSLNVIFAVSTIFRHMNSEGATASYSSWVHGCVVSHYILQCSLEGRVSLKAHQQLQMNLPVRTKGTQILHACLRNNSTVRLEFKMGLFKFVRYTNALDTGEVENTIAPIYKMSPF